MASEKDDIKFVSKLNEESQKKAKKELNELNDTDRILAVQSFRQWVLQQKWLKTPTEFEFLLRFLRARKFSQLEARKTLENYWTCKTKTPEWYRNVDPSEPAIQEIIKTGFYVVPKELDKHGRRVIIEKLARLDLNDVKKKWGVDNVFRAITLICDWANRDENIQVNGIVVFIDNTDVTMGHMMTLWNQENGKRIMQFYQNSLPARMKGLHLYNEPSFFDAMYALFSPLMKQKTKDRMFLHGRRLTKVYEEIGMSVLPDEYLPDDYEGPNVGSCEKIVEEMLADMQSNDFREYIKHLSSDEYGVDLKARKNDDTPVASFRKLNVD
ncbi:alpha-tocopherol transfer protein-like [Ruditapes philippinarum]|uniref:alpha-tocopherol transfer protein-like n=1 Tax=Ruditapes philippinarum TaxID=129788 RepID=UPI00295A7AA9|nr:alpha-tocopherol transfer protein-like [Ruditapes philippinarum]